MAATSLAITYQDLSSRTISLWTVVVVSCVAFFLSASHLGVEESFRSWGLNILFLVLQFSLLSLIFGLSRKQWNFFDTLLGWGDVLYLCAIAALFSTVNFLLFYSISLIASLLGFMAYRILSQRNDITVPLAGALATCCVIFVSICGFFGYNPWDEIPIYLFLA